MAALFKNRCRFMGVVFSLIHFGYFLLIRAVKNIGCLMATLLRRGCRLMQAISDALSSLALIRGATVKVVEATSPSLRT